MICVSDIQKILKEYDMEQSLCHCCSVGEVTILRYLKGQMLLIKSTAINLKAIMNPYVFAEIFESNKEVLVWQLQKEK